MLAAIERFVRRYAVQTSIVLILVLAACMRFYHLSSLPPGLHPDEAANGIDIFKILEQHDFRPFYSTNGGREALFFYIQAASVAVFGNTTLALRLAPALIGTLAVGAVYLWLSSWFNKRIGMVAAFLMAVTPWAVIVSRDGFRAGMVALMVPLTLWLYTKAIRTRKTGWIIAAGISFALGFYTYIAYRLFVLVPILIGLFLYIRQRDQFRRYRSILMASLVPAAIVLIPMAWYAGHHPVEVFARAGGVSVFNQDLTHTNPVVALGKSIVKTAGMFNFHGDNNYRQNVGGQPELNVFIGVMFVLGLLITIRRRTQLRYVGLLTVFGVMMIPEILSAENVPHALRAIGALPAALGLAALGIEYFLQSWQTLFPLNTAARFSANCAVAILLLLTAYQGYVAYFVAWANAPETYRAYSEDASAVATYFNTNQFDGTRYAVASSYTLLPVQYLTHNHATYTQLDARKINGLNANPNAQQFAILEHNKQNVLNSLKAKYPKGSVSPHYSSFSGDELFVTYTVPNP